MKHAIITLSATCLLCFPTGIDAHVGDIIWLIFEIPSEDIIDLDFHDGSIEDWKKVVGDPTVLATDTAPDPSVPEDAGYNPADMDFRIWLGWNADQNLLYGAMERTDDIFINQYAGGDLGNAWQHDGYLEFMVDGDHSGGDFSAEANENWTTEEKRLNNNRSAQNYIAIADAPDNRHVSYQGAGTGWVTRPPYADAGGVTVENTSAPFVRSVLEFYVTPFDDLLWDNPKDSRVSQLEENKIIGFQLSIPDFDIAPGEYDAFRTLSGQIRGGPFGDPSGQASTWRYADRFVDGLLIVPRCDPWFGPCPPATNDTSSAINIQSWGRIKFMLTEKVIR